MNNPKSLGQHMRECPALNEKITDLVLCGPFDSFHSSQGRAYQTDERGMWLADIKNKFIQGKL